MVRTLWTYSISFALGVLVAIAFEMDDWRFWVTAIVGNILIVARDNALYEK
jgi:hypothetical protein